MRTLQLVQKDFLLTHKQLIVSLLIAVLFPIFMYENTGKNSEIVLFLIVIIFSQYTLFNSISLLDNKYESEKMFLILPYRRMEIVLSRYVFLLFVFFMLMIGTLLGSMISPLNYVSGNGYIMILMISSTFFGILLPIQYHFGYEKTKYFSFIIVFAMPFLSSYISSKIDQIDFIGRISQIEPNIRLIIMVVTTIIITSISIICSSTIFNKKDL